MKPEKIDRACPVCLSRDESHVFAKENINTEIFDDFAFASRKIPEYMHHRLIQCPTCGCIYSTPLPLFKEIHKAYSEAAFDSAQESYFAARRYGRFLPGIIKKLPDLNGALDIGTGDGAFLEILLEKGFKNVVGVEPSKAPIIASKETIRPLIRMGVLNKSDFKTNSFSLITCFQTMEHLYDPLEMCMDAYDLLKENGAFLMVSHNCHAFSFKILGKTSPIFDVEHLQFFSPKSARNLLKKAGFVKIDIQSIFNTYPLHYWVKLLPIHRKIKLFLVKLLKKNGVGNFPVTLPAGNMVVLGYKAKSPC